MGIERTFVLGGSRSGKSLFAERLVNAAPAPWIYLASARPGDDEMRARIAAHAARRGEGWRTIEAPLDVAGALDAMSGAPAVIFDCATLWLSNHLLAGHDTDAETERLTGAIGRYPGAIVTVSNEVGHGGVADNALARKFADAQGRLNQRLVEVADRAVLVVAGLPLVLKGTFPRELLP